ncbi:peptide chain release factor 1 [candidate division WOR-1 bacterium RIFOXYA12_FULL_43_27]|uniref:Peptide chain release factor 1 n=1 Tax=candidate division WOR-1 bacterium RIFOXYC2_FULL_46_14 TaxID=1802587 RepID=A0A1F4U3L9_UNCSA|nr:MAG: peptide chain release factor 1 [candidate division WOR-1 bacterium RIFOXYA12_FULL_43_27]OGC20162.1 MAG: peptide chain release factor 1 [candidate division WOR-1 bacterium RIFOXYB2_FULL_46_45]OGC32101.1 MAG: peptide chain release factor 1 [candidate division WOR-1 bacterium RIFOXYA2_FULL_46_56]OGC39502.1 MAG: peptide chain release factor 1 [candidate division WOR-1 bacterium RIFOXYC2_FULL_46_14]
MLEAKLSKVEERYNELETLLSSPEVISNREKFENFSREFSELGEVITPYRELKKLYKEIEETKKLLSDPEMEELAKSEMTGLEAKAKKLEGEIEFLLLPKDPNDDKNIIIEIRGGTGGDEAALFAGELLRMYTRYAEKQRWKIEFISTNPTGLGGYKEAIFTIIGKGAYSKLKYEGGVHRVQRVPATEASGRVHTSAASVVVMPEAEDVDIIIEDKELRVDTYRAGGPGGQNVNKVSSAIRITHLPTGLVVACQEERSQLQNRAKAMKLLKTRLLEAKEEAQREKRESARKIMVGSGDRSEKIRTYNFPQGRVTDHRINFTIYKLQQVMEGDLDELVEALATADRIAKLSNIQ